ncbi:hypothetical protein J6590_101499 [Homalodisca vitripennis]|nr:hypothetical protein J6590_101499 [Homalodisca vitripennis]
MKNKKTFSHSNKPSDHMIATGSTTRHHHSPPSSKPLTPAPKRARSSIHLISSGRAFKKRQASTVKDLLKNYDRIELDSNVDEVSWVTIAKNCCNMLLTSEIKNKFNKVVLSTMESVRLLSDHVIHHDVAEVKVL